jgi:trans-aconitate 2-methyltransferase
MNSTVATWDPEQYLRFGAERLRPAVELLQRVSLDEPARIYDLGCGPGTVTQLLCSRWPGASVIGVDASETMLARAAAANAEIEWRRADLSDWEPEAPADLLYSNAALHWLDAHEELFPRLFRALAPGGALAVQMPSNFDAPSHTAVTDALAGRGIVPRASPLLEPAAYYDLLASRARSVDLWETRYFHVLEGHDPVVEWTKGTTLRPVLERLAETEREAFLDDYRARIREAYPRRADGRTVLPFKRLFLVAVAP